MSTHRHSIIDANKRRLLSSTAEIDPPEVAPEEDTAQALKTRDKGNCAPADEQGVTGCHDIKSSPAKPRGPPAGRRQQRTRRPFNYNAEGDCYSIEEFCLRHRISIQLYHKLRLQGLTPAEFRVGTRVLISKEAAAAWRRAREAETAESSV